MIEIRPSLFIGIDNDYRIASYQNNWAIVHACKEPYHRRMLGYTTPGAPKNHPEYLFGIRGNRLILNFIDADDVKYVPKEIIDAAIGFIDSKLGEGVRVLVHCNQGQSRSPSIGLLYLATSGAFAELTFAEAESRYKSMYPSYSPAKGIRECMALNWANYCRNR
jgi:predicted protein tyrosine phosphatase